MSLEVQAAAQTAVPAKGEAQAAAKAAILQEIEPGTGMEPPVQLAVQPSSQGQTGTRPENVVGPARRRRM